MRRLLGSAAILGVIVSLAAWPSVAEKQAARARAPVTLPFKLVTRHMVMPVSVNASRPLAFVLVIVLVVVLDWRKGRRRCGEFYRDDSVGSITCFGSGGRVE